MSPSQVTSEEEGHWGQRGLQSHVHSTYLEQYTRGGGGRGCSTGQAPARCTAACPASDSWGWGWDVRLHSANWRRVSLWPGGGMAGQWVLECVCVGWPWAEQLQPPEGPWPLPWEGRGLTCQGAIRHRPGGKTQGPPGATRTSADSLLAQKMVALGQHQRPSSVAPTVFASQKAIHSLEGALGGRFRPPGENQPFLKLGRSGPSAGFSHFGPGRGVQRPVLCQCLTGGQRQESSRFRKTFPGLPSDEGFEK